MINLGPSRETHVLPSVVDVIGSTPLVELSRLTRDLDGRILAKLEYLNPGFSKKDRIARQMIEDAEEQGKIKPGDTIVELTSGNTGIGLAIVCGVKGYKFVAVMSRGNSIERARMMAGLGAEVILVDQSPHSQPGMVSGEDIALVEETVQQITADRGAYRVNQFTLEGNVRAHYRHTGPEILRQSNGEIDVFCDYVGTAGSFAGCSKAFKEYNDGIKCFIIEPDQAAVLAGEEAINPNHRIQGGGYSIGDLQLLSKSMVDGFLKVSDEAAISVTRRLANEEGIFAGFSSGANAAAALTLLATNYSGATIVVLMCDSGLKYLSTDLWENSTST